METNKISVIIPVYNGQSTLQNTLAAVQAQTYRDFEVILVNDGSTDQTEAVCRAFAQKDTRVQYYYQKNAGVSAARNFGMQMAEGAFFTFLDADDTIDVDYLEILYRCLSGSGADVAVCNVSIEAAGQVRSLFSHPTGVLSSEKALEQLLTRRAINSGPCAKLYRKELVKGLAFPPLKAYEDILFVKDVFDRADQIAVTDRVTYHYLNNAAGAMEQFTQAPTEDIVYATEELLRFICTTKKNLSDQTFYITASHLMQYVLLQNPENSGSSAFLWAAKQLFARYRKQMLRCSAFPWKEKIIFIAFSYGWLFHKKAFHKLKPCGS